MPKIFAFQLVADALGVRYEEGKARWDQAQARLKRQKLQLPPTSRAKPPGARQHTPTLDPNDAPKALALVLKDPLEFFEKDEKLVWLRSKVQEAGGDPKTVDAQREVLLAEKAQREADAQSLVLPGLKGGGDVSLRTARENDEVLGSIFDYLRWLGVEDEQGHTWANWLCEEFHSRLTSLNSGTSNATGEIIYIEKIYPGQHTATPFTNFSGYRLLTKLCLHKSKIAQGMYDQALVLLGKLSVGDQRLHEVLDVNAASSSCEAKAFVLGASEANAQKGKSVKTTPLDLDAFERRILEDVEVDSEVAARQLAKAALARQFRESSHQQLALVKRQKIADIEKSEAETRAAKEKFEAETKAVVEKIRVEQNKHAAETKAAQDAAVEKMLAERDTTQVERARIQATRQEVEDIARSDREERDRQRAHAAELATEKRRAEIRKALAEGAIAQVAAEEMLGEHRRTPILRFEPWITRVLRCTQASSCSAELKRRYNASVASGAHVKPISHRDAMGHWSLFEEHDGTHLRVLHQAIHDARNGVQPGQQRLFA